MTTSSLLLHVGYHKTATTWLQNSLFQPAHGFHWVLNHAETFDHLVMPHGLVFDTAAVRDMIAKRRGKGGEGHVDVISLEALVGNPFYGGRESEAYAARLAKVAPGACILFTIREQIAMIASVYMQYLRRGGTLSIGRFLDGEEISGYFGFDALHFEYDRLVGLYQRLFGAENVHVLPLETIARDQAAAVADIAGFAGNTVIGDWQTQSARGVSASEATAWALRRINHLQSGPAHREPIVDLGGLARFTYRATERLGRAAKLKGKPVTAEVRRRYDGRFIESNQRLHKMISEDAELGRYQGLGDIATK